MIPFPCVSGTAKIKGSKNPDQWLPVTTMRKWLQEAQGTLSGDGNILIIVTVT